MTNHGGRRARSGRPRGPHPEAAHRQGRLILLSDAEYAQARAWGDGNASAGVRAALAALGPPRLALAPPDPSTA